MDWNTLLTVLPTALSATLYAATQTMFLGRMIRKRPSTMPALRPWVSILKPIAGLDEGLRENLESFAELDYPAYEILFGVASADDPALPVVQDFLAAHPGLSARLVRTTPASSATPNPKVAQLIDLTKKARGSVLVVSDANVRVPKSYLHGLVGELLRPGVGLVSSVITGAHARSLGALLESAQLGAYVAPAVISAQDLGGRAITVGKSMAMRRADLERVGGWECVASVLAEDDVLGQRFDEMGFAVRVCLDPIENPTGEVSLLRTLERHTRWAKMRRSIVPACFALEPLLSPLLIAAAVAVMAPGQLALRALALALALQVGFAFLAHRALRARSALLLAALEPARCALLLACWLLACAGRRVSWRGHGFTLGRGSQLVPIDAEAGAPVSPSLSEG